MAGSGERCVVFGASSGIGAAVVESLVGKGHPVVAASRRGDAHPGAVGVRCDVRDSAAVAEVLGAAGDVDWVVNAAGVGYYAPFEARFQPQWRDILDTNVLGLLNILARLRALDRPPRHFVQVGSLAGARPSRTPGNDVYAASKAAGTALLARFRSELRAAGSLTKITLVTPGYVAGTDFGANFFRHAPEREEPIFHRFPPLSAVDVAASVEYALAAPEHVELSELVVRPVEQPD